MKHTEKHPLAMKRVKLKIQGSHPHITTAEPVLLIEDWWDILTGGSWMDATGNPTALIYAFRAGIFGLPKDDEVVYGKVGAFGHLIHVSELGEVVG